MTIGSIPSRIRMAPDLRHAYDLIDVNVYQENIFHTKMLLHDFKLDNYLFDMTEKDFVSQRSEENPPPAEAGNV